MKKGERIRRAQSMLCKLRIAWLDKEIARKRREATPAVKT